MATIIVSPENISKEEISKYKVRLFLAGGISNCPDWQSDIIELIQKSYNWKPYQLLIFNPRRVDFDTNAGVEIIKEQVKWEYDHLHNKTNLHLFWFPKETVCPITLYELGRSTLINHEIIVGCDQEYMRKTTLEMQLQLANSKITLVHSIEELVKKLILKIKFNVKFIINLKN